MRNGIKQINKYLVYDIFGMAIYGLFLYFGFTWLAGFSLVYGFLWNYALIIIAITFDGYANKMMQSDKIIMMFKEKYGIERACRLIAGGFITFKTLLYLFYLFILIASQIIDVNPTLLGENLVAFILANNYSILFLLAFDSFIGQFSKDKGRKQKIIEKIQRPSAENQN
jgi:hypothetical protein